MTMLRVVHPPRRPSLARALVSVSGPTRLTASPSLMPVPLASPWGGVFRFRLSMLPPFF